MVDFWAIPLYNGIIKEQGGAKTMRIKEFFQGLTASNELYLSSLTIGHQSPMSRRPAGKSHK